MSGSHAVRIGNKSEDIVLEILINSPSVQNPSIDLNYSKYDELYISKITRTRKGLQVKTLGKVSEDVYHISDIHKYMKGTLMVCVNEERKWGLAYLSENNEKESTDLYPGTHRNELSSQMKPWKEFLIVLESLLHQTYDLTDEIYLSSISPTNREEMYSRNRIKSMCDKFGLSYSQVRDGSSAVDIIIEGYNVQIKYKSNSSSIDDIIYSYKFTRYNGEPYAKGMNTLYLFEQGMNPGYFIILHENVLINLGYIKTDYQEGRPSIDIHEFYHDDKMKLNMKSNQTIERYRHKWTCNPLFWWSIEHGHIVDLFIGNTIEKGVTSLKDKFIEYCNLFNNKPLLSSINLEFNNTSLICRKSAKESFAQYCNSNNIVYTDINGNILLNGLRAKFYYADKPSDPKRCNSPYMCCLVHRDQPLYKGNAEYYIFAIGGYEGKFMILNEETMIHHQLITTPTMNGKKYISIYSYDYVEKCSGRKGNWTCDKKHWYPKNI